MSWYMQKENNLDKNTIVVLTSDHGFHMGEKDYLYKNSLWEESTRVPLIIRAPGISTPGKVDRAVSLIDIYFMKIFPTKPIMMMINLFQEQ